MPSARGPRGAPAARRREGPLERCRAARRAWRRQRERRGARRRDGPLEAEMTEIGGGMRALVEHLESLGIELRDLEQGLVDFPGERDGEPVWLCWVLAEPEVAHWHPIDEGSPAPAVVSGPMAADALRGGGGRDARRHRPRRDSGRRVDRPADPSRRPGGQGSERGRPSRPARRGRRLVTAIGTDRRRAAPGGHAGRGGRRAS